MISVNSYVEKFFKRLGKEVSKRPWHFIFIPILIGLALIGAAFIQILCQGQLKHLLNDVIELYTPYHGITYNARKKIDAIYKINTTDNFVSAELNELGYLGGVFIRRKDGGNILNSTTIAEVGEIDRKIRELSITWKGQSYNYSMLCAKLNDKCEPPTFEFISKRIKAIEDGVYRLPYPFYLDLRTRRLELIGQVLGKVKVDKEGFVKSAQALMILYHLDRMLPEHKERANIWEDNYIEMMKKLESEHLQVDFLSGHTIEKEFQKNVLMLFPYLVPVCVIMIIFGMWTCSLDDWIRSKPWLGVIGCVTPLFSVAVSFSFCLLLRIDYLDMNMFISFIILGIGMDDTFMLICAWRQTDPSLSVEQRMEDALSHVGISITITSLTNLIAFFVGTLSPFSAVFYFSLYISISIIFCYLYQITVFCGAMVLFGRLEARKKHSFIIWKTVIPKSQAEGRGFLFRLFFTGENEKGDIFYRENRINAFFRDTLGGLLNKTWVKMIVSLVFIGYISGAIYGLGFIKEDFNPRHLVKVGSYGDKAFETFENYFYKYQYRFQVLINDTLNYSDPRVQINVENLLGKMEALKGMSDPSISWSWLKEYKKFQMDYRTADLLDGLNMTNEVDFIRGLREVFFRFPLGRLFKKDVVFNNNYTQIKSARYFLMIRHLRNRVEAKEFYNSLLDIKEESDIPVEVYSQIFYLFEQYTIIKQSLFYSVLIATVTVLLTVFLFTPDFTCCVSVAFGVVSIILGVIGYMSWWDIKLDAIVMLSLVMSIGLSVDYVAHVSYAYANCKSDESDDKISHALFCTAYPVVQSCLSTLIGVFMVFFIPSTFFLNTTKNIVLLLIFSLFNSLFFLPVLLSFITDLTKKSKMKNILK